MGFAEGGGVFVCLFGFGRFFRAGVIRVLGLG